MSLQEVPLERVEFTCPGAGRRAARAGAPLPHVTGQDRR